MLSDAVPAGSQRSTSIQARNPPAVATTPTMNISTACVTLHCVAGTSNSQGSNVSGSTPSAICHVMKRQHVEARGRAGNTSRQPCPQPSRTPTARPTASARGRPAMPTARRPARAQRTRSAIATRLRATHALVQHGPRDQQRPERHREDEHRRASGAAAGDRHGRRAEVDRRLEERRDQHRAPAMRPHAAAPREQHDEQRRDGEPRAVDVEGRADARAAAPPSSTIQLKPQTSVSSASTT